MAMETTTAVAVWGAALSTGLAAVKGVEFWRDRPRLRVGSGVSINRDVPHPLIRIEVTNNGRQPVTIVEAGFVAQTEYTIDGKGGEEQPVQRKIELSDGTPRPGSARRTRPLRDVVHDRTPDVAR